MEGGGAQLVQNDNFTATSIFWLWGIVVVLAVFVSIAGIILTHIVSAILEAVRTGDGIPEIGDLEDVLRYESGDDADS